MSIRRSASCLLVAAAALAVGALLFSGQRAPGQKAGPEEDAIRRCAQDFARAFAQGDAKALAGFWTEQGECHEASGAVLIGRDSIAKAFAAFFKEHPGARLDVMIHSIRFPAPDLAIEEGVLRLVRAGKELPTSSLYSIVHVRQGNHWRIAVSREWGANQDRLEDLDWLIGRWQAGAGAQEVTMTFARDARKPFLTGEFKKTADGKAVSAGTLRIGLDPRRGQLRSWHFDEDGGHGEALWLRDGNRWIIDAIGVLPDGRETGAVYVLGRVSADEFTWRSIDRVLAGQDLPDTVPIKLRRVAAK